MKRCLPLLLFLLFWLLASPAPHFAAENPENAAISVGNFLRLQIIDRFQNFRGKIKISSVQWNSPYFLAEGRLTAENKLPMDLLAQFLEALEASQAFPVVVPSRVTRVDVDDPTQVSFELRMQADLTRIPENLQRENRFSFTIPPDRLAPADLLVEVKDADGIREITRRICQPGELVELQFPCRGKTQVIVRLDSVIYRRMDIP